MGMHVVGINVLQAYQGLFSVTVVVALVRHTRVKACHESREMRRHKHISWSSDIESFKPGSTTFLVVY
jgi:hypothetical protein